MIARPVCLALLACTALTGALAQPTLADLVAEAQADWMFGSWEAATEDGSSFTLTISWDLDKKVVVLHGKGSDMEFKGYTALEPGDPPEPKYTAYDNRGVVTRGAWSEDGGELVLRLESRSPERTLKMAAVFGGNATDGLSVRLHRVDNSGGMSEPADLKLKFKKKK